MAAMNFKEVVRMSGSGKLFVVIAVGTETVPFAVAEKVWNPVTRVWDVVNSWTRRSEKAARRLAWAMSQPDGYTGVQ